MEKADWLSQVKRGILEYSIMTILSKQETYGYDIITKLAQWDVLATKEGTVYPLLKRLERDNLIHYSWKNSIEGLPPRKYYRLTPEGIAFLKIMDMKWANLNTAIDTLKH